MAFANFQDIYIVVGDTSPTTQVYSTASNAYVANNAAAYDTWLNAGNFGFFSDVSAKANNGAGLVRLTLDASQLQTGQRWLISNVSADANGIQIITKIDATHVDLQGTTFNAGSTFPSGTLPKLQGAAIVATDALARAAINGYNIRAATPSVGVQTSAVDIALTNPAQPEYRITMTTSGKIVRLPRTDQPGAIPVGSFINITNEGVLDFQIAQLVGSPFLTLAPGDVAHLRLDSVSAPNGSFSVYRQRTNAASTMGHVRALGVVNNAASPTTKFDIAPIECVLQNSTLGPRTLPLGNSFTLDIGLAGPAANGRDQAAAFGAGTTVHIYAISSGGDYAPGYATLASLASPGLSVPTLPTNYSFYCYLFSVILTGSNLPAVKVRGNFVAYNAQQKVLATGAATVETAVTITAFIPPIATNHSLNITGLSGGLQGLNIRHTTGTTFIRESCSAGVYTGLSCVMPNTQNLYYLWDAAGGQCDLDIMGYFVPNGGN